MYVKAFCQIACTHSAYLFSTKAAGTPVSLQTVAVGWLFGGWTLQRSSGRGPYIPVFPIGLQLLVVGEHYLPAGGSVLTAYSTSTHAPTGAHTHAHTQTATR